MHNLNQFRGSASTVSLITFYCNMMYGAYNTGIRIWETHEMISKGFICFESNQTIAFSSHQNYPTHPYHSVSHFQHRYLSWKLVLTRCYPSLPAQTAFIIVHETTMTLQSLFGDLYPNPSSGKIVIRSCELSIWHFCLASTNYYYGHTATHSYGEKWSSHDLNCFIAMTFQWLQNIRESLLVWVSGTQNGLRSELQPPKTITYTYDQSAAMTVQG